MKTRCVSSRGAVFLGVENRVARRVLQFRLATEREGEQGAIAAVTGNAGRACGYTLDVGRPVRERDGDRETA